MTPEQIEALRVRLNSLIKQANAAGLIKDADDNIIEQPNLPMPSIIGVTKDLKDAQPVRPVTSSDVLKQVTSAVDKAATQGDHVFFSEIVGSILRTVSQLGRII